MRDEQSRITGLIHQRDEARAERDAWQRAAETLGEKYDAEHARAEQAEAKLTELGQWLRRNDIDALSEYWA